MAIRFRCHHCSGLMSISSRKAGSMVQCPTCGGETCVPLEDQGESPPRPPHAKPDVEPSPLVEPEPNVPPPHTGATSPPGEEFRVEFTGYDLPVLPADLAEPAPPSEPSVSKDSPEHPAWDAEPAATRDADQADDITPSASAEEPQPLILRRRATELDEMDLTPMVDVTFQLLIFFMVTASFAMQKSIEVPTPDPDQKGAAQQLQILEELEGSSIRVLIDGGNAIVVDDDPVGDPARLPEVLQDKMRREQKTELLITAHPAALHRSVITVIDAANHVGMQRIRMVSRKGSSE